MLWLSETLLLFERDSENDLEKLTLRDFDFESEALMLRLIESEALILERLRLRVTDLDFERERLILRLID